MLNLKKLLTKVLVWMNALIVVERVSLTFSSGSCTLPAKSGYTLLAVYPIERSDSSYGITDWTGQGDGSYVLKNKLTTLNATLIARVIWIKL